MQLLKRMTLLESCAFHGELPDGCIAIPRDDPDTQTATDNTVFNTNAINSVTYGCSAHERDDSVADATEDVCIAITRDDPSSDLKNATDAAGAVHATGVN